MLDANPHYGLNALRTTRSTQEQRVEDNAFHPVDRLVLKTMRFNSPRRNKPAAARCLRGRRIEHTAFIHRNFIELGRAGGYF
jgi:hypothetical protein